MRQYQTKMERARRRYTGHKGDVTMTAVEAGLTADLKDRLTGEELGQVMDVINAAYHRGKADAGAEIIDDCVWVSDKLIPLTVINRLSKATPAPRKRTITNDDVKGQRDFDGTWIDGVYYITNKWLHADGSRCDIVNLCMIDDIPLTADGVEWTNAAEWELK